MAKQRIDAESRNDEFSRIFSEYHARIDEITRRTEKKLKSLNAEPEEPASAVVARVAEDSLENPPPPPAGSPEEEMSTVAPVDESTPATVSPDEEPPAAAPADEEPADYPEYQDPERARTYIELDSPDLTRTPIPESAEIIRDAKKKAKKIVEEAEHKVKKEAKKKTQSQVDKILERAKKEAEDIVYRTRQAAEAEKNDIIDISRREAEKVVAEITEKCRQESQSQSSQAIADAREKARKIMADAIDSSGEINRLITEVLDQANQTVAEFEARLREETGDLARIITETRARMDEAAAAQDEVPNLAAPPVFNELKEEISSPTLVVHFLGERSNGKDGTPVLFHGQVEMKSSSAIDYQYLKNLKKHLVSIPDVKYLQEYASEKEMSVLFDIREPMPLVDVLRRVPLVQDIVSGPEDDLIIIFRPTG